MEEYRNRNEEPERDIVFSHSVKAGKRIYYLDVRKTRKDEMYLSITESKKIADPDSSDGRVTFEKHKIFLYREDFSKFIEGLSSVMSFIHDAETADVKDSKSDNAPLPENVTKDSADFDIEF